MIKQGIHHFFICSLLGTALIVAIDQESIDVQNNIVEEIYPLLDMTTILELDDDSIDDYINNLDLNVGVDQDDSLDITLPISLLDDVIEENIIIVESLDHVISTQDEQDQPKQANSDLTDADNADDCLLTDEDDFVLVPHDLINSVKKAAKKKKKLEQKRRKEKRKFLKKSKK